jgi:hypothetical protein
MSRRNESTTEQQTQEFTMKIRTLILGLGLIALPGLASAAPGLPILPFASVRSQVQANAQQAGYLNKGSGERLTLKTLSQSQIGKPGEVAATIRGTGGMIGTQKNVVLATAKFKVTQVVDGQIASPEQQSGQTWLRRYYLLNAK